MGETVENGNSNAIVDKLIFKANEDEKILTAKAEKTDNVATE